MNISYFDLFIYMQLYDKVETSFLKSNIQFEKFDIPLRRTSIGFLMNYTKFFPSKSKMNETIIICVTQNDVDHGLASTSEIRIAY